MLAKFDVLQQLDRHDEVVKLHRYWRQNDAIATDNSPPSRRRQVTHTGCETAGNASQPVPGSMRSLN